MPSVSLYHDGVEVAHRDVTFGSALWRWDARNATLDPNSAALVAAFQTYGVVNPNLATTRWSVATATADSGDPTYAIPRTKQGGSINVRVKLGTQPDPAGDGHLTIRDLQAGVETDFWQAIYSTTTQRITSCSAAVQFPIDSVNEGTAGWGGNAANTPLARGLVTAEQLTAGLIDCTLQFGMPKIGGTTSTFRYPGLHNAPTCGSDCVNHMVEGTWVRLDPAYDVAGSALPAWQKTVARALQDYGMILRDNSGSLSIYGKNPVNGGAAWTVGSGGSASLVGFPWSRLQVLNPPGV